MRTIASEGAVGRGSEGMRWGGWALWLALAVSGIVACAPVERRARAAELAQRPIRVVATTTLVADLVRRIGGGTELEFVIMVIAVSCVKLLSAHNSTQHTSRKHTV